MLRKLLNRLFVPFSSGGVIPLGEFLILLQKSYAYLRKHRYRVLSSALLCSYHAEYFILPSRPIVHIGT